MLTSYNVNSINLLFRPIGHENNISKDQQVHSLAAELYLHYDNNNQKFYSIIGKQGKFDRKKFNEIAEIYGDISKFNRDNIYDDFGGKYEMNDDIKRKYLVELENYNNNSSGGYKMKKSKKSKSKASKTTPKKAKSTKKPKTTRTQTKSYNNPKYKNQDGGFVRGGVLFPESFYRSDIVM